MTKRLLDIDDAADYLNVSPRFIRRLTAQRRINYLKIGKFVRFDQDELDDWVQAQRVDAR
jgi:excisionase family DNA binding protein